VPILGRRVLRLVLFFFFLELAAYVIWSLTVLFYFKYIRINHFCFFFEICTKIMGGLQEETLDQQQLGKRGWREMKDFIL